MNTSTHLTRGRVVYEAIREGATTTTEVAKKLVERRAYYGNESGAYAAARAVVRVMLARGRITVVDGELRVTT